MVGAALGSFGGTFPALRNGVLFPDTSFFDGKQSILPYGNGRSYGDSCLNNGGTLIDMRCQNRLIAFDPESGIVEAEAGILLGDIIAATARQGWFLPVTPGTRFVTLGGAIANDVHGKNHHKRGTFGRHVLSMRLVRSDRSVRDIAATDRDPLFAASIGGMGLTGIIVAARLQMMRIGGINIDENVTPFSSLGEYFDMAEAADSNNEYAVAWLDQLATGAQFGRGLLMTGNHANDGNLDPSTRKPLPGLPFTPPFALLNRPSIRAFNQLYRAAKSRGPARRTSGYAGYFYPLDGVANWNRFYGPKGLYQHQSVVPEADARRNVAALIKAAQEAGQVSFLTVLKRFGDLPSPGLLSFPRAGYTLTLDFPNRGQVTRDLMDRLDAITMAAGGAVNPYKDARMSASMFRSSFPMWEKLEAMRDPAILSDFWRRTALAAR
jgi:FAD/FMN-containing dehydrogenase